MNDRPYIVLDPVTKKVSHQKVDGKCHEYTPAKVVLTKHKICVGCTDITVEAIMALVRMWEKEFNQEEYRKVVAQDGFDGGAK